MKIINPFEMNDWDIKKLIIIAISLQFFFLGTIGLDLIGLHIPLLRQFTSFINLLFIPGFLLLRLLKLHKLGSVESLCYSIGLSISFLMFIGFIINIFYPLIGLNEPISLNLLLLTICPLVLLLCIFCYYTNKEYSNPSFLNVNDVLSKTTLLLILIPILSIFGTYLINYNHGNLLLIITIFLISLVPLMTHLRLIESQYYPLTIYIIASSLLFHNSLISMYHLSGWDIQTEYYLANKILEHSIWNFNEFSNANAMLSIVMFAPIYSTLSNLDLIWTFKIVYPLIFSFVPLSMYATSEKMTTNKVAFMSVFFFIFFCVFYTEMLQLARQQLAELFTVLVIMLIVQKRNHVSYRILLILFSFSLVVSHYGLSYIFIGTVICSFLILVLYHKYARIERKNNIINERSVLLIFIFLICWYMYISSSSAFISGVNVLENIINSTISDFLNPNYAQGIYIFSKDTDSFLHSLYKYLHIFTQICISVGIFHFILLKKSQKEYHIDEEYLTLSLIFYTILVGSIIIPNFSSNLNTSRIYQITLLLLSPFFVIGILQLSKLFWLLFKLNEKKSSMKFIAIFLSIFLLFNTGWIYEVSKDTPTSFSLNNTVNYPKFNEQEVFGKNWLYQKTSMLNSVQKPKIYADAHKMQLLKSIYGFSSCSELPTDSFNVSNNSYIYYSEYNLISGKVLLGKKNGVNIFKDYYPSEVYIFNKKNIYSNGDVKIYN